MPPKKNDKKGGKGGNAAEPKEIDAAQYIREPVKLPELPASIPPAEEPMKGEIYNISTQFAEWGVGVGEEAWDEPIAAEAVVKLDFPALVQVSEYKPAKEFICPVSEEAAAAGGKAAPAKKEAPKKGGKGAAAEVAGEVAYDEAGTAQPRVFVDSASASANVPPNEEEHKGTALLRGFKTRTDAADNVDPLVCAAFQLVQRFSATACSNGESPYLWRAIYPQLPSGRPCYNASGKYVVKLFIAGKWRKVYVTDEIPLGPSGAPAVAYSAVNQELWPLLLAKAIYTVYTAFGYSRVFGQLGVDLTSGRSIERAAAFVGFAVHLLTGWLPSSPMSMPEAKNGEEVGSLLQDIAYGGCHGMRIADKTRSSPFNASEITLDESEFDEKYTKRVVRDLKETKRVRVAHLKRVIAARQEYIRKTSAAISAVHNEVFCIITPSEDGQSYLVHPILALASESVGQPAPSPGRISHAALPPISSPTPQAAEAGAESKVVAEEGPAPSVEDAEAAAATEESDQTSPEAFPTHDEAHDNATVDEAASALDRVKIVDEIPPLNSDLSTIAEESLRGGDASVAPEVSAVVAAVEIQETVAEAPSPSPSSSTPLPTVQVLVDWAVSGSVSTGFSDEQAQEPSEVPETEWKQSDVLRQKWVPVASLCGAKVEPHADESAEARDVDPNLGQRGVCLLSFETRARVPNSQEMHWSWVPETPAAAEPQGKGGKAAAPAKGGKDKKGGGAVEGPALSPLGVPTASCDAGVFPPTLLSVDVSEALNTLAPPESNEGGLHVDTAIQQQQFVSISVMMQSDVLSVPEVQAEGDAPSTQGGSLSIPDDAVLVLQEIRCDGEDPLVMRIALPKNASVFPFTRTTFHIPTYRLHVFRPDGTNEPGKRLMFWVRLFTRGSVQLTVTSSCKVAMGPAETVWAESGEGVVTVAAGEGTPVRAGLESLIFRTAFFADAPPAPEEGVPSSLLPLAPISSCVFAQNVMAFVHISDRFANKSTSIIEASASLIESMKVLPRVSGNVLQLSPIESPSGQPTGKLGLSVIARCFSEKDLPAFKWKLVVLSRTNMPLTTSWTAAPETVANYKRFAGAYTPNNKLVLFRDQISFAVQDAPLAVRLSSRPIVFNEDQDEESLALVTRIIRPTDRAVLREFRGRSILPMYSINLKDFPPTDPNAGGAPAAGGKAAGKKDDKGKGKGAAPTEETVDVIIECMLDETSMMIPEDWRSRWPYKFNGAIPTSLGGPERPANTGEAAAPAEGAAPTFTFPAALVAPKPTQLEWVLDIIGGNAVSASHDLYDLRRFCGVKNSWIKPDESSRFDRAVAAAQYNAARITTAVGGPQEEAIVGLLATALDKEAEEVKPSEAKLPTIPKYSEFVTPLSEGAEPKVIEAPSEEALTASQAERDALETEAKAAVAAIEGLNGKLRVAVEERVKQIVDTAEQHQKELRAAWQVREEARKRLDLRNASLSFLLDKAADAKTAVYAPAEDKNAKGAKGKKK